MTLAAVADPLPFSTDRDGVVRVGGTRVTLESVVYAFQEGSTAEEISQQYPSLDLADVYAVIGYYLRHRDEVDGYLAKREKQAEQVRNKIEGRSDIQEFRQRLLARRDQQGP